MTACSPQGRGGHQVRQTTLPQDPKAHQCHQRLHPDQPTARGFRHHLPHQQLTPPGTDFHPSRSPCLAECCPRHGSPQAGAFREAGLPSSGSVFWVLQEVFVGGWVGEGAGVCRLRSPPRRDRPSSCLHAALKLSPLFLVSVFDLCPAHHGPRLLPLGLRRPLRSRVSQLGSWAPLSAPFRGLLGLLLRQGQPGSGGCLARCPPPAPPPNNRELTSSKAARPTAG